MSTEVSAASSGLIWGMPDEKKRVFLDKSWKRLATTAPNIFKRYQSCDDPVLAFLRDFFPSSSQSYTSFLSNVALKNWRNKANIAFRIPNHPLFSALLPDNSCISVTVHCSTDSYYPLSFPSNIFLTHNDAQATSYEHKIDLYSTESSIGQRTKLKNVISTSLVEQMPAVSLEAYNKLKLWENFQDFKENLIIEKSVGLKYIDLRIDFKNSVLKALVVAENKEQLIRMRKALARKTIFLSNISLSADAWSFRLAESNGSYFDKKTHEMVEFGQLKGRLDTKVIIPLADTVGYVRYLQETPEQWIQPVTTWVDIELSDEWIKKLDDIQHLDELELPYVEKELIDTCPRQGFITISLMGDKALIDRHRKSIRQLYQHENCYAPNLASYLFDTDDNNPEGYQSRIYIPKTLIEIPQWFNHRLNDTQKSAVRKMLSAQDLCLIQGPPGTGKTTVIAEAILQFIEKGKKVLLASQSHDAIDNALSRLQHHPQLKVIRLARNKDRINKDAEGFTNHLALSRHYHALDCYVKEHYLDIAENLSSEISVLEQWLDKFSPLTHDISILQQQISLADKELANLKQKETQLSEQLSYAQQTFATHQHRKNALIASQQLLQEQPYQPQNVGLPTPMLQLAELIFQLKVYGIELPFTLEDLYSDPQSQFLCFEQLLNIWHNIVNNLSILETDIIRLQNTGNFGLTSLSIRLKIQDIEQEIEQIRLSMLAGEPDPDQFRKWQMLSREVGLLKNQAGGLDHPIYQNFTDKEMFHFIQDPQQVCGILKQRYQALIDFGHIFTEAKANTLVTLQSYEQKYAKLSPPSDDELFTIRQSIDRYLQQDLPNHQHSIQQKLQLAEQLLKEFGIPFQPQLKLIEDLQKQKLNQLKQQEQTYQASHSGWNELYHDWHSILAKHDNVKADWDILGQDFVRSCNVVAISCNENERTLTDNQIDGFDVVIIDEVSKATPVELLQPLMKARTAILVGDHRQLPPVFQEDQDAIAFEDEIRGETEDDDTTDDNLTSLREENFNRYRKLVTASLFKELFEAAHPHTRERLNIQFRMHPQIMDLINNFYENQLYYGNPETSHQHNLIFTNKFQETIIDNEQHVLWIDTSYDLKGNPYTEDRESITNALEAKLIAQTLLQINEQKRREGYNRKNQYKVGIVSFYQAQVKVIKQEILNAVRHSLGANEKRFDAIDCDVNTVIRYQGKEKPTILISLVRNDGKRKEAYRSSKANVARFEFINVAMSRAQDLLMVFGARNVLEMREVSMPNMDKKGSKKVQVYRNMFAALDQSHRVIHARDLHFSTQNQKKRANA